MKYRNKTNTTLSPGDVLPGGVIELAEKDGQPLVDAGILEPFEEKASAEGDKGADPPTSVDGDLAKAAITSLQDVDGMREPWAKELISLGILSRADLAKAKPADLEQVKGIGKATARKLVLAAKHSD
ncbi:helix-hairpin-helix domain-containing protein [bacterium]|nr:helix-hairpin-helix domain-containing protein [bacterium]